jgi:hypothetical protein
MRKLVAVAAALGLIAGICIFIASFFGLTMDKLGAKAVLLRVLSERLYGQLDGAVVQHHESSGKVLISALTGN